TYLSQRNYASGDATLNNLNKLIDDEKAKIALTFIIPETVKASNAPPNRGYSRQSVNSDIGTYLVDIIAADLNTTRVIVDTASDSDCSNDCPVLSLGDYVSRNGAFAGVNGSYFCPAEYPSCAGKTNSFDTLLMNKNKKYLNSDNNKYSNVPLIYFSGNSAGVRGQSLDWGRDTGVDMVLANQGLLLSGGNIAFGGDGDPKKGSKGSRSFVGNKGTTAYIGVVYNATVAESAYVLKTLGLENALNLDSGGSTALWSSGYKAGPGRNIPNAVLFVGK
ncbi:MAG: phosphodiester glycosidase family protein, partial [Candidatus Levybacteria bacterium]|nr:phosphodiester glycosidase family protein [Candidatus Levybacteria bacterium]